MTNVIVKSDIAQIVALASSLSERLDNKSFNVDADLSHEQQVIDKRMRHWCQVVAQGNWENFHQRLSWDGLDVDRVRSVLGSVPVDEIDLLPSWAETLSEIIQTGKEFTYHPDAIKTHDFPIETEKPLPFEDLLLPAVLTARQKLLTSLGSDSLSSNFLPSDLLSLEACLTLEHGLLKQLVNLCAKTLEVEFSRFRPLGHSLLNLVAKPAETTETKSKVYYSAFVEKLLQDGLLAFFQQYPVLGRLVAIATDLWVEAAGEFLQRLKADCTEIQQLFLTESLSKKAVQDEAPNLLSAPYPNSQLGKVIKIQPNLSDPHNRGRSVIAIEFEFGLKLVYKPKNLGLEVAYNQFLDWCNQHGVPLSFKVIKVCDRQTYGWVEYVEQQPLENELAAQRFYQRAGMLLCVLHLLQGTDCHNENLIACGEHFVLVDMETLMHHEVAEGTASAESIGAESTAVRQLSDSVLRTGMLPGWEFPKDQRKVYDVSGLGGVSSERSTTPRLRWKLVNTDDMHLGLEQITLPVHKNEPILNAVALSPNSYLNELIKGFEQMYSFLVEQRQELLMANGPLNKLQAQQVRFVFRNTKVYGVILQASLAPQFLQNGVDRSIELDILSRAFRLCSDKPKDWWILRSELKAMEQLDIPYFRAETNSDDLTVGLEQPIEGYFQESSQNQVLKRLQVMNEADLAQQVIIIKSAFYAKMARDPSTNQAKAVNTPLPTSADFSDISLLTPKQLLDSAQAIARSIQELAIRGDDGSANWIGLSFVHEARRFQLNILHDSLYDGNCGVALFLAALDCIQGDNQFRDIALGAIQSLRTFLQTADRDDAQEFAMEIGLGGASGLGSFVYCLVKISQFLQEPSLLEDGRRAANLITPEIIAEDQQLDIIGGSAGAILGLLALYSATGERAILEKAIACGQHLLAHRVSVDGSPRAWKTLGEKPLTGFSHGVAGIAYALLRLYSATHDCAYKEAAIEGIAYEHSIFKISATNLPDFRSVARQIDGYDRRASSWCNGAAGISLARLGSLETLDTEEIRQELEVALQVTQILDFDGVDSQCCGNFGRIEVLLVAAKTLRRDELFKIAYHQASVQVARAKQTGGYQIFDNLPNSVFSPGFFLGTSGIGYGLLRLAYPEKLPSILLMA
jgi:type 2 lantibiotic biosynthesis protein LanM